MVWPLCAWGLGNWQPDYRVVRLPSQIWHLSEQMAQKTCRFKRKTFGAGNAGHCTGVGINGQNAAFATGRSPAPPFPLFKEIKCRTDRGFMHPTASNRALIPKSNCAT